MRHPIFALALIATLAACTQSGGGSGGGTNATSGRAAVGYVRMEDLVKFHPLYPQLSKLDDDVAALQLKSAGTGATVSPADLDRERAQLQRELDAATRRAQADLKQKQEDYSKRENEAIQAALGAAAGVGGGGGASITSAMQAQLDAQAKAVSADAQRNLDAYRDTLLKQDNEAVAALSKSLNAQAMREYRTQAEGYQKKEADYALQLASQDSAQRLSLRAKLSNLVLDDAARADARKQLDALDRKEADELAAMKNRDASALADLQRTLREQTNKELNAQAAVMRKRTIAKIDARSSESRRQVVAKLGSLPAASTNGASGTIPVDMRAKLEALHKQYQDDFNRDAQRTIDDFQKTKMALAERFAKLQGIDLNAEQSANKQIALLQRQRSDLYGQMVAQINREVKLVAARRGITVVFSNVLAPAGGVDLTSDAEKDIESLHE